MKTTLAVEHYHPNTVASNVHSDLTIEWPGGEGYVFVQSITLAGAGTLTVTAAQLADGLPLNLTATGAYPFWSEPGTITVTANVPGGVSGDVAAVLHVVTK